MSPPEPQDRLSGVATRRGMRLWNVSAAFSAAYSAITMGAYSTGYALYLGASDAQIGFLAAAPAWAQVVQMFSPILIERSQRRKPLCIASYAAGYAMWLPIALIPFVLIGGATAFRPWAMIILVALSGAVMALAAPAGTSWFTDLVPPEVRGRFVARQQSIVAAVGLAASIAAGRYMDAFPGARQQTGFVSLFMAAVVLALVSVGAWAGVPEPAKRGARRGSVMSFLTLPFRNTQFRNLTLFVSARSFSVMVAGPFFAVYMLRTLEIPYGQIAILAALATVATMAANPFWGYLADRFGYKPLLSISSLGIALTPLPWFFATKANYWFTVSAVQIWAGVMSAGIIVSQFNLMIKTAPAENRSIYLGAHAALASVASALGSMLGGLLAGLFARLGPFELLGYPITNLQCVFLVSSLLRFLDSSLLTLVKEEREVAARSVIDHVRSGKPLMTFWSLLRMARALDAATRAEAAEALGKTRSMLAANELIPLLDDSDREVRRRAARGLGEIGDAQGAPALIRKLREPMSDIVEEAAEALGSIRTTESLEALLDLLEDPRSSVRKSTVLALAGTRDARVQRRLEELLQHERDPMVVLTAIETLTATGSSRALHLCRRLLGRATAGLSRRQLANAAGNLLGPPGEFYRLLQADAMLQEEMVARILARARRRLGERRSVTVGDRQYVGALLGAGLECFAVRAYAEAVVRLHTVAALAARRFTGSERIVGLLSTQCEGYRDLTVEAKVQLLLRSSERLRANFGFLSGLRSQARRRPLHHEEALLGAFAFDQAIDQLTRLARGPRPRIGEPESPAD